jgi:hypothetical protein
MELIRRVAKAKGGGTRIQQKRKAGGVRRPFAIYVSSASRPLRRELSLRNPHGNSGLYFTNTLISGRRKSENADLELITRLHVDMLCERVDRSDKRVALDHSLLAGVNSSD